jgi:predicted phosphodiesterase
MARHYSGAYRVSAIVVAGAVFTSCAPSERAKHGDVSGVQLSVITGGTLDVRPDQVIFHVSPPTPAALQLSNRDNPRNAIIKIELRGRGLTPAWVFPTYGRHDPNAAVRASGEDSVTVTYLVPADSDANLSVETPVTPVHPTHLVSPGLEITVNGGAILDAREGMALLRVFSDTMTITINNSGERERHLTLTLDNLASSATLAAKDLTFKAVPMPTGMQRVEVAVPSHSVGTLTTQTANVQFPLTVLVGGDVRQNTRAFAALLDKAAARTPAPALFLMTGDYTEQNLPTEFPGFFWALQHLPGVPVIYAMGNHDLEGQGEAHFRQHFGPTRQSLRYGPLRIVVVDNSDIAIDDQQFVWLEKELQAATEKYKIVLMHAPPFAMHYSRNMDTAMNRRFIDIVTRTKADYVLAGHSHLYARAHLDGVTYLVSGGAGAMISAYHADPRFTYKLKKHLVAITFFEDHVDESFIPFVE